MEPSVVVVLIGAAVVALLALGKQAAQRREPVPVRVHDDAATS